MRRHRLLLFLAAVFAAKLVVVLQLRDHPLLYPGPAGFESGSYITLARGIQGGDLQPSFFLIPPVYVYWLALVFGALKIIAAVTVVQVLLGTAAVACVFAAARIWFGRPAAWIAAVLAGLTGLFTFYEATILPSALDPFLTAVALAALAAGLSPAAGARGARRRDRLWLAVSFVALVLLLLNRPRLLNIGLYFYVGNNAVSDGTYRPVTGIAAEDLLQQREDARTVAEASAGRKLDDTGVSAYFSTLGRSWVRLHPGDAAAHLARKLALMFNSGHIASSYSFPFYAFDAETLLAAQFVGPWLLLPLGLTGLVLGAFRAQRGEYLAWVAFVPLYALGTAVFFVTERGRLPLLIPLCIGAGAAADFFISRGSRPAMLRVPGPRATFVLGAGVVVCGLAFLTNLPMPRDDGRAEERTRMAEAMIVRDRVDLAEQWSARAAASHPRPAEVHVRVGQRLVVHSRPAEALPHLERALQLDPSSAAARYAMGQALVQARRPQEAIPHLRAALQGGVRESLAGYELARAFAATGNRAAALQTLQVLRPEDPADVEAWNALGQLARQLESPSLAAAFFNGAARAQQMVKERK